MLKKILFIFLISHSTAFSEVRIRPQIWATEVMGSGLDNIYKLDEKVYRSEQPDSISFGLIEKYGIEEVLNLRENHSDENEANKTNLVLHRIKVNTGKISYAQILQALKVIKNAKGPVLIHCWHGSDRTGVISASYRIVFQGWTKADAIDEFKNGGYGYHQKIYPQLIPVIENIHVESFRKALKVKF